MEMYQIVQLVVAAAIVVLYFVQKFTGINFMEKVIQWKPVLVALSVLIKSMAMAIPNDQLKIAITVLEAASKGTETAEELWKMGQLPKNERNEYAQVMIAEILKKADIEVTSQIQMIINGGVEIVCMLMPHGVVPEAEMV